VTINKFVLEPLDGGTVNVTFRAQTTLEHNGHIAYITGALQEKVLLTITAGPVEQGEEAA